MTKGAVEEDEDDVDEGMSPEVGFEDAIADRRSGWYSWLRLIFL